MKIKCSHCGYEFEDKSANRCPRCNTVIVKPKGCENCKGCSMFGACSRK